MGNVTPKRDTSSAFHLLAGLLLGIGVVSDQAFANHIPSDVGHVYVAVSSGLIQHRNSAGNLLETLDTLQGGFTTGMAFDTVGNLYVTNFNAGNVRKFGNTGALIGTFGSGYSGSPESIVFDRDGKAYVGAVDGDNDIRKFDPDGNPLAQFDVATESRGSDWIELANDQCTMFYTSEGQNVKRFDVCSNEQLSDFNVAPLPNSVAFALRLLPGGGLLVANTSVIARLDSSGNLTQTYDASGENCWFSLNFDPDGTSFWSADFCSSNVYKFDIETGQQQLTFNTGTGFNTVFGLAIFGEPTVAAPTALRARVGNERVYLEWDALPEPVDGYRIHVERFDESLDEFIELGTVNPPDILIQNTNFTVFAFANGEFPENGQLYKFILRAVKDGVDSPPSLPAFATPGEFAATRRPEQPILLLHGFLSDAETWETTSDFFTGSLSWKFGGELFNEGDPIDAQFREGFLQIDGDFFTVTFGNARANYGDEEGISHQSEEVADFLQTLLDTGVAGSKIIVAHSMGGLAARAYLANAPEAAERVSHFITYGTPHRGGSGTFFDPLGLFSDGVRDMEFDCTAGILTFSDFLTELAGKALPDIRYTSIFGDIALPRLGGCFSSEWDEFVAVDSARLRLATATPQIPIDIRTVLSTDGRNTLS